MNNKLRVLLLISLVFGVGSFSRAQSTDIFLYTMEYMRPAEVDSVSMQTRSITPMTDLVFLGTTLVRFYQEILSSQDKPVCMFSKSCSNFALEAIRKKGIFVGIILTSDRLQRCNGLSRDFYKTDPRSGLAIDPIVEYVLDNE